MKINAKDSLALMIVLIICMLQACGPAPRKHADIQVDLETLDKKPVESKVVLTENGDQCEGLEDVEILYALNMYKEALLKTENLLGRQCSREVDFQIYKMMGRIYDARKDPANAAYYYMTALEFADLQEQETVRRLAIQSASCINTERIVRLSDKVEMMLQAGGDLLFGVGMAKYEKGEDKDSLTLLQAYLSRYPQKKSQLQAETVIQTIENRYAFNRYRIGVLLPLSGVYAPIGNNILMAIHLALNDYDRRHANAMFQLIVRDTQADPNRAIEAVRELDHCKVSGIIGPMLSANAAAGEANKLGVPMIVLTQKEAISGLGQYIFRHFITPRMQMEVLVAHLTKAAGVKRFAVLHPDDKYGRAFSKIFVEMVGMYAGDITEVESYAPGQTDFADQIKNFVYGYHTMDKKGKRQFIAADEKRKRHGNYEAEVGFEVLFIPDTVNTAKLIAPQLLYNDINNVILAGTNLWQSWDQSELEKAYVKRVVFPSGFDASSKKRDVKWFVEGFESEKGQPPGFIEAVAYDTSMMMMEILSTSEVKTREDITKKLKSSKTFSGITGNTSFDPFGESVKEINLVQLTAKASL